MSCRVTIVGTRRRLDADLPDTMPVAELLADVAGLLGENENGALAEWGLLRVGGARLDPEMSLGDQGVTDGTMLFLRDVSRAPAAPAIEDFADHVAILVDAQKGRWTAAMPPSILGWVAAGCLAASGAVVLATADAGGRALAGGLGAAVAALAALALVRLSGRRRLAAVVMFGALPAWASAGAGIAGLAGGSVPAVIASGLAGTAIGAVANLVVTGDVAIALIDGVFEAAALPAVVLGIAAAFGGGLVEAAAVLAVLEMAVLAMLPAMNVRLARIASEEGSALARRLAEGRRVAAASHIASSVVIVASSAVLVASRGSLAYGLVGAAALATLLRGRHYRFAAEVAPLLVAGLVSLGLLQVPLGVAIVPGSALGFALLLIADGFVLVAAAVVVRRWSLPPRVARWLRPLELVAVSATVPLALGVLGLYDAVVHYARGLG